jgi:hypothetical protein
MKSNGFKNKYSALLRKTPLRAKTGFKQIKSPFMKRSAFKTHKPLSIKQKLDAIVSKCVRLGSADENGMVYCVTCSMQFFWKEIHCGHFQKRGNTSTRYDIRNLAPQCETCNCFNDGENEKFAVFIDTFYGPGTAELLKIETRRICRYFPYEQELEKWNLVYKKLVEEKQNIINY